MNRKALSHYILAGLLILSACRESVKPIPTSGKDTVATDTARQPEINTLAGGFSDQKALHFDSSHLTSFLDRYPAFEMFKADLYKFYRQRNYAYAWYDNNGMIEQADALYNRFIQTEKDGLTHEFVYAKDFHSLMDDNDSSLLREPANADAELMLTAQYFNYAHRAWQGLPDNDIQKLQWYVPRKKLNLPQLMDSLLVNNEQLKDKEPVYRQYALLKKHLGKYRQIEKDGGWPVMKIPRKSLKLKDSGIAVHQLIHRLWITGDFVGDTGKYLFDPSLEAAVKQYQSRNGLTEDGIAGPALIRDLNQPCSKVIEKILVNMERCRWLPDEPGEEYFVVNIPAYKLYLYYKDSLQWDMNVVTGAPIHKTTVFSGKLNQVVFSPYWNVPTSIYKKEILPGIQRDPQYLKKHNMEKVGQLVRQKPGPNNSLGLVKFLFPNSYSIYFHDTPAKSLFNETDRAFSHGCIRLSDPYKMARYLLRDQPSWTADKIDKAMHAGKEQFVAVKKPVPVYIVYFTAWSDRNGQLNLRKDIYGRDSRLSSMVMSGQ